MLLVSCQKLLESIKVHFLRKLDECDEKTFPTASTSLECLVSKNYLGAWPLDFIFLSPRTFQNIFLYISPLHAQMRMAGPYHVFVDSVWG